MHLFGGSSSFLSDFRLPALSSPTLLLSFLFSLFLLAVIRLTFLAFSTLSAISNVQEKKLSQHQHVVDEVAHSDPRRWLPSLSMPIRKWSWKWEGLPISSPISFSFSDHEVIGRAVGHGVGITTPTSPPPMMTNLQLKSAGPSFEQPLPAIYETEVPVSMAKMIMSRHTSRRPTPVRPPRRITVPAPRRTQSMV